MNDRERERLLDRIERQASTVGADVPAEIEVQGESVALRDFVLDVKGRDTVPEALEDRVEDVRKGLKRERLERRQRIERDEVSDVEEGERLVAEVAGIDRAINALESLEPADLEAEMHESKLDREKRWVSFLRKVT